VARHGQTGRASRGTLLLVAWRGLDENLFDEVQDSPHEDDNDDFVESTFPTPCRRITSLLASIFTNNAKKWRDMAKQVELHAALFYWWLGVEVSFLPTMKNHHVDGNTATRGWEGTLNKIRPVWPCRATSSRYW
jgi:hypothetical protein